MDNKPEAAKPVPQKMDEALAAIVATCARCDGAVEVRRKGKPYWEPIAMGGPFVMNTEAELKQAYVDFRQGLF